MKASQKYLLSYVFCSHDPSKCLAITVGTGTE